MARACLRLADVLEPLPLLGARAANLRRGVPMLAAVRNARCASSQREGGSPSSGSMRQCRW